MSANNTTNNNKRSSLLLSNLSAINTSCMFSSESIASYASSGSPTQPLTPLCHPTPRRCSAANSSFMKSDAEVRVPTPPRRPLTPLSPAVARNRPMSFFDFDSSEESECDADSPMTPYILSPTFQDMVVPPQGLRTRWADLQRPPTPAPNAACPTLPPNAPQRAAIKQWEAKVVPRYLPSGPATPIVRSPVEEEIGALSQQITELHAHIAASERMFKSGMMYVYMHQNAQAAALVSPSTTLHSSPLLNGSNNGNEEEACMVGVKQSLRDRLEKEVNEVERRALRDLEMVRGVRHGLILEAEREAARERRRALEAELKVEMEREKERQQMVLQQQQQQQEEAMDIDTEDRDNESDEGFYELMLDEKSIADAIAATTTTTSSDNHPDEIVFKFSTEEIESTPTPAPVEEKKEEKVEEEEQTFKKPPTPRIRPTLAPLKLSNSSTVNISSPMLTLFRSPISPCFSPCSPLMTSKSANFNRMSMGSARMSVDFAAGLGFDITGMLPADEGARIAVCA